MADARLQIVTRAVQEIEDGMNVNLGIGMPTLVANEIPSEYNVLLQSENGLLGIGPYPVEGEEDPDLINAGKETVRVKFSFLTQAGFAMETFRDMAPGSRCTLHVDEHFADEEVSLVVEETEGKGIVVERAMYFEYSGRRGGHAAMGVPQTGTTWYFAEGYTGS